MKTTHLVLQLCVLLGIAGIAFLLTGCREYPDDYISKYCPGSCTVIKGRVTTDNGSVPVAGATLRVQWNEDYQMFGGTTRNKAVATTDANGNYELRFLLRDEELISGNIEITTDFDRYSYISCQLEDYFHIGTLSRDTTIIQNYTIAQSASIAIALSNQEPLHPTEKVWVSFKYKLSPTDPDSCMAVRDVTLPGYGDQVTVPASTPIAVRVEKTKAGVSTIKKEVLTLQPGEKKIYEVTF